jgi:uncharacterized protein YxeA
MKRFLSILLVIILVISCSITAFAQTTFKQKTGIVTSKDGLWSYVPYNDDNGKRAAKIYDYNGSDKSITLPTEVDNLPVTYIADFGSDNFTTVEHIIIPKNYTRFYAQLFDDRDNLKSVTFSREYKDGDITVFGNQLFRDCDNLEKVVLPNCLPSSHNYNGNLQKFYDGAKLRECMFENCKKLKEVVLPEQLAEVDIGVFRGCESLETIKLPDGVVVLGEGAFEGTKSLKTLVVPDTVEYIRAAFFHIGENANVICNPNGYVANELEESQEEAPHDYNCKLVSSVNTTLKGDINKDNKFNVLDVTALQKYLAKLLDVVYINTDMTDFNGDSYINVKDATAMQKNLAKIDSIEYVNTDMIDHNQDGKINIIDCTKMQKELVKIE